MATIAADVRSPTSSRTEVRSPTSTRTATEVRSPTSTSTEVRSPTSTSTEVRSPTSTSTDAYTRDNVTVTGGAGAGSSTVVEIHQAPKSGAPERAGRAAGRSQEFFAQQAARSAAASRPAGHPAALYFHDDAARPGGTPAALGSTRALYDVDDSSLRGLIDEHPVAASAVAAVALTAMILWLLKPKDERW